MISNSVNSNGFRKMVFLFAGIVLVMFCFFCASCKSPADAEDKKITSVTITAGDFSLAAGNTRQLAVNVLPDNAAEKGVRWSSSAMDVATVNTSGLVSALAAGSAAITASAIDGSGKFGTVTLTVHEAAGGPMTPQEIFAALKGQEITTNGWADLANSGAGLAYANPAALTLIDDETYPNAQNKLNAFTGALNSDAAAFIIVSGDIDLSGGKISDSDHSYFDEFDPATHKRLHGDITFNIGSNTTIIGINNARFKFGGLRINNKNNIIIRNVTFWDAHGSTEYDTKSDGNSASKASIDALVVQGSSSGVWVDHCLFTDGTCSDMTRNYNHDGSFDIPQGKDITVSWCEFTNHDKVMLVAGNDSLTNVEDRQVTLHHNYFYGATQRMPRTRGTQMHIYNNYYNNIGVSGNSGYCMGPGVNAHFIVENNYFGAFFSGSTKVVDYYDNAAYPALVYASGNNKSIARSPHDKTSGDKPWQSAYNYTLEENTGLPESIPAGAGPKLVFNK
jgi:pectate lyase